ncbi:uncharacterized protein [Typha angustifolia]|uniref:uncharacterized protein isoform X2 n=1 Tax=Typha angustifolia TaxID=59011 RepID=UPI003C2BC939
MVGHILRFLRCSTIVSVSLNFAVAGAGATLLGTFLLRCGRREVVPVIATSVTAAVRVVEMVGTGVVQGLVASTIVRRSIGAPLQHDDDGRVVTRMRYKRWLWWTRFGMIITALQFFVALYLTCILAKDLSSGGSSRMCFSGQDPEGRGWKLILSVFFLVLVWLVVIIQCSTGSDVLRWRSFYASRDAAWKAHYREVFDHGIREVLCCMGRTKYLSVLEDDEIYSVARLLGDLVAYRASGTGHLELLAGLALLQKHKKLPPVTYTDIVEAPEILIQEAALFHQFAEAAYTGPLLDFGRNPILFPCVWLYRQEALTPWTRSRRPVLEGDNWWRGHAAAFLKYVDLSPEALRQGRVSQKKREAAYFVVVLHDLKTIVIAVRGTETPEDLITDGLCRECSLTIDDLDGLINNDKLPSDVRESILSSFPHYGHSGIVESARELFMKIDGQTEERDESKSEMPGLLSSLLGTGCECHGYSIRIVGHSLGGAVAVLLGIRLYGRYPNLHVYSYGTLPCIDSVIAEACSEFVTSIVYNDEFSARLSVNSILRLRAAAIGALSNDCSENSAMIAKLVRRVLNVRKYDENGEDHRAPTHLHGESEVVEGNNQIPRKHLKYTISGGVFLCGHAVSCMMHAPNHRVSSNGMGSYELSSDRTSEPNALISEENYILPAGRMQPNDRLHQEEFLSNNDSIVNLREGITTLRKSEFLEDHFHEYNIGSAGDFLSLPHNAQAAVDSLSPINVSEGESPEMYLPGLIIHIVPGQRITSPLWKIWISNDRNRDYKAFVANRESFRDIIVSPYMFLDHVPWRCHYAMQRVLESRRQKDQLSYDLSTGEHLV